MYLPVGLMLSRSARRKGRAVSESSKPAERSLEDRQLDEELVEQARSEGVDLGAWVGR